MNSLKILHLSNVLGDQKGGGIHEVVSNFYKYQIQLEHHPSIWYPGTAADAASIRLDNNVNDLATFGVGRLKLLKGLVEPTPEEVSDFDIIHQHGIWTQLSFYSQKLKRKTGLKMVIPPLGFLEPYRLNISKYKKKIAYHLFEKSYLSSAAALVACSEDEAVKLKNMFPNTDVAVVFNGIALIFF